MQADAGIDDVIEVDPPRARSTRLRDRLLHGRRHRDGAERPPLVVDDPALLDPAEPIGTGRLFHVGLPAAHVTAGPLDDSGNTGREATTADRTPAFAVAGDGACSASCAAPA